MKTLSEYNPNQPDFTVEQKLAVAAFVASVFELYPGYDGALKKSEAFKSQCRIYVKDILAIPEPERLARLEMLKAVKDLNGNELKFLGNYKTAQNALGAVVMAGPALRHDYAIVRPRKATGEEWKVIMDESAAKAADPATAMAALEEIRKTLHG